MDWPWLNYLVPTGILVAGVINDLKSRKVRNELVLVMAAIGLGVHFYTHQLSGLGNGLLASLLALGICLPMVLGRFLGAGDMKLMMAFGLAVSPSAVFWTLVYAFVWGLLLGLVRATLQGQLPSLLVNTFNIIRQKPVENSQLHRIPFTVAFLFGWLHHIASQISTGGGM